MPNVKKKYHDALHLKLLKEVLKSEIANTEASYTGKANALHGLIGLIKESLSGKKVRAEKSLKKIEQNIKDNFCELYQKLFSEAELDIKEDKKCYPSASTFSRFYHTDAPEVWTIDAICVSLGYAGFGGFQKGESLLTMFQLTHKKDKKRFEKHLIEPAETTINFREERRITLREEFESENTEQEESNPASDTQNNGDSNGETDKNIPKNKQIEEEQSDNPRSGVSPENSPTPQSPDDGNNSKKKKWWIWVLVTFIFLVFASWTLDFTNILPYKKYQDFFKPTNTEDPTELHPVDTSKTKPINTIKTITSSNDFKKKPERSIPVTAKEKKKSDKDTLKYLPKEDQLSPDFPKEYFYEGKVIWQRDRNDKFGLINDKNQILIPHMYDDVEGFYEGVAWVKLNGKYALINLKNEILVPFTSYQEVHNFSEGVAWVKKNNAYALIKKDHQIMIPFTTYEKVYDFKEGLACVGKDSLYGFVDKTGKTVIPFKYEIPDAKNVDSDFSSGFFNGGFSLVRHFGFYGIINSKGEEVLKPHYKKITLISSEFNTKKYRTVENMYYIGVIDSVGKIIVPAKYRAVEFISEKLLLARESFDTHWNSHHIYTLEGKKLFTRCYYRYPFEKDGLAGISDDGKFGYINKIGNIIVPFEYKSGGPFSEGLARVEKRRGKNGYINIYGQSVIPFIYWDAYDFSNGKAIVRKRKGKHFYINKKGVCIKDCQD